MLFSFLLIWGSVFSALAGVMAFLITYKEMYRHYVDKKKPLWQSARIGFFTFAFFLAITIALAFGITAALGLQ